MDSSLSALQTNGKLFSNFELVFKFLGKKQKISKQYRGVNIDQSELYYISMDLTREALQTNVKLFKNFGIIFQISYNLLK